MQIKLRTHDVLCVVELQWGEVRVYTPNHVFTRDPICDPRSEEVNQNDSNTPAACNKRDFHESVYRFSKAPFRKPLNYLWR